MSKKRCWIWGVALPAFLVCPLVGAAQDAAQEEKLVPLWETEDSAPPDAPVSTPPDASDASDTDASVEADKWTVGIHAVEEYRVRYATAPEIADTTLPSSPAEGDQDLRILFAGNALSPQDRIYVDLSLGMWADIGQTPGKRAGSVFASQYDEASPIWLDLYSMYGEYHGPDVVKLFRLGRQQTEHGRPATFDGATMQVRLAKQYLEMFAFGGRTVHFFNTDDGLFEDFMASGGFVIRPAEMLRFELDYRFLKEDVLEKDTAEHPPLKNHSYGISGWLHAADWFYLKVHLRGLDDRISRLGGASMMAWDDLNLGLDLRADLQLVALYEVNEQDNPYYSVLGHSRPNTRMNADLWKAFDTDGGTYTLHAGWNARRLVLNEPSMFNRDFGKAYVWFQATDIGVKGPFAGAMLSYHYVKSAPDHGDDRIFSVGGSLGWDREPVKFEAGTYFSKFKYDYYQTVQEKENVRTYFGEISVRVAGWFKILGRYEFERFDRDIHQATLSLAQTY